MTDISEKAVHPPEIEDELIRADPHLGRVIMVVVASVGAARARRRHKGGEKARAPTSDHQRVCLESDADG